MNKRLRLGLLGLLVTVLVVVLGASAWAWLDYRAFEKRPILSEDEPLVLMLEAGTSYAGLVRELERRNLTKDPLWWRVLGWRLEAGARLQAGEYRVDPGMRPRELLQKVMAGRVVQYPFTIVEGWSFDQLRAAIAAEDRLKHTLEGLDDQQVMARLGHPEQHPEGRFLPETYHFTRGTPDIEILKRAYRDMAETLEAAWEARDTGLPYRNPDEVLVMASIIEKETAVPEERRRIAGVFVRRLQRGMRLQTDPTVIYGLGKGFDGNLRRGDLRRDNPYNTYTRGGLPPTPIAMPGRASIRAAVHPADGEALYFVSRGDGTHVFSETLEEHNRAVARYQLNRNGGP
jgi:UPF0755 protein